MRIGDSKPSSTAAVGTDRKVERYRSTGAAAARPAADVNSIMGIPDTELTPKVRDAILTLMGEVDALRRELTENKKRIQHLEQVADQDALAPVSNRRAFIRELTRVMAFSERHGAPASLIYFDLNGLKAINDTYGHAAGDAAIVRMANLLLKNVRTEDVVGRLGGDEFAVLLTQADQQAAIDKAHAMIQLLASEKLQWEGVSIPLEVAFGVYAFKGGEAAGDALEAADRAMYAHKLEKRGTPAR